MLVSGKSYIKTHGQRYFKMKEKYQAQNLCSTENLAL
jgi:hypothetical protein